MEKIPPNNLPTFTEHIWEISLNNGKHLVVFLHTLSQAFPRTEDDMNYYPNLPISFQ